jgi:hypothetical protein
MVRTELLRAKSLHAEVHYLKDLQKVGDIKRHHDQQSKAVKEKENQFWKEAVKSRGKISDGHAASPRTAEQTVNQLDRMWRAHSQLKEAHQKRESSAKRLQEGLATLSTSKQRIESLQKLVSKAEKLRANRLESRISEEVAELVGTTRAIAGLRGKLEEGLIQAPPSNPSATNQPSQLQKTPLLQDLGPELGRDLTTDQGPGQSQPDQASLLRLPNANVAQSATIQPQPTQALPVLRSESLATRSVEAPAPLHVSNVEFQRNEHHSSLTISASVGMGSPVNLVITKGDSSGLKVLVDPGISGLAGQLSRDKGMLASRLQALGIKVTSLEVGPADDSPQQARRNSRKLLTDPDEELIA